MDDLISKKAVLDAIDAYKYLDGNDAIYRLKQWLNEQESVQPKMGRWIRQFDKWGDTVTTVHGYECSECNVWNVDDDNYCPNCGAKMEGVAE